MAELVRKQAVCGEGPGGEVVGMDHDILANGVGRSFDRVRRPGIAVQTDRAEVLPEERLGGRADARIESATPASTDSVIDRRALLRHWLGGVASASQRSLRAYRPAAAGHQVRQNAIAEEALKAKQPASFDHRAAGKDRPRRPALVFGALDEPTTRSGKTIFCVSAHGHRDLESQ